jgi:hypothetical protein
LSRQTHQIRRQTLSCSFPWWCPCWIQHCQWLIHIYCQWLIHNDWLLSVINQ